MNTPTIEQMWDDLTPAEQQQVIDAFNTSGLFKGKTIHLAHPATSIANDSEDTGYKSNVKVQYTNGYSAIQPNGKHYNAAFEIVGFLIASGYLQMDMRDPLWSRNFQWIVLGMAEQLAKRFD